MKNRDISKTYNDIEKHQRRFLEFLKKKKSLKPRLEAFKIIGIYILFGVLWILLSGKVLEYYVKDVNTLIQLETYKGWAYVVVTGIIFYFIILNKMEIFKEAVDTGFRGYEELSTAHEELIAMDEELEEQFNQLELHRDALIKSDERYKLAVEGANDGIWDWDIKGNTYFFSLQWKEAFGYKENEISSSFEGFKSLLHPEDKEKVLNTIDSYLSSKRGFYEQTYRLRCKDGSYRWILSRGKAIWDSKDEAIRMAGSHTDITEYIELQEKLHREKELSENIINGASIMIVGLSKDNDIILFNPFAEKLTGYKKDEVLGKKWFDIFIPPERTNYTSKVIEKVLSGKDINNQENKVITKDGRIIEILWNNSPLYNSKRDIIGFIGTGLDITERKIMENKLYSLAYYDSLTGLPNRQLFEINLYDKINKSNMDRGCFALLYLDIDNFKNINDTLGHAFGDKVIKIIAKELKDFVGIKTNIARFGGDDFALIYDNIGDKNDLLEVISSIMKRLNRFWEIDGNEIYITVSIGISLYPNDGHDVEALIKNADTAMHVAKEISRNSYVFYSKEMNEKTQNYITLEKELIYALSNDGFIVYYQPLIDLKENYIIGFEALVRWNHPVKGIISPMEFIPFAEETGLIIDIDDYVFNKSFKDLRSWLDKGFTDIKLSLNLSSRQLRQVDLIEKIDRAIKNSGVYGKNIIIEITESSALFDLKQSISVLNKIKELGITIALDDFGTGYSSLNYLKQLPIDIIKMDKEFIRDLTKNNERAIAEAVISLAHNMNKIVTAEGIETKEQLKLLRNYNCHYGQGYYFSRPVPIIEAESLLTNKDNFIKNSH